MAKGRKTGGRVAGTPNKSTASLKEQAREYTPQAIEKLADIMMGGEGIPAAAQVAAIKEILDRGYGKASTVLTGDEDGGPVKLLNRIELVGVRPGDDG